MFIFKTKINFLKLFSLGNVTFKSFQIGYGVRCISGNSIMSVLLQFNQVNLPNNEYLYRTCKLSFPLLSYA